jgi:2-isopropylmalate synthase
LEGGADILVLCDTNGGSLPEVVRAVVAEIKAKLNCPLGIHTHNDGELAVANSLAAVEAGCEQVQGTVNGYGERCGNANLISVVPNLQLKMGKECVPKEQLAKLTQLSRRVSGIANLNPDRHAAFVGMSAFSHKGGIHVAAVEKNPLSYEHIEPEVVGNQRRFLISELSGRGNLRVRAQELGLELNGKEAVLLEKIKQMEYKGYLFEDADGSFELMVRREDEKYKAPFEIIDMMTLSEKRMAKMLSVEAMVKVSVGGEVFHTVAEGDGPVHALDQALRKALLPAYPCLNEVQLADYKVRILNPDKATAATTRVTLEAASGVDRWVTVGVSYNIVEASLLALSDALELFLLRKNNCPKEGIRQWKAEQSG